MIGEGLHQVTLEEAERTEHLPDCAGYEDCQCFHITCSYKELYELQELCRRWEHLASKRAETLERTRY